MRSNSRNIVQPDNNWPTIFGLVTLPFGSSGLTIHDIMSGSIARASRLDAVPTEIITGSDVSETLLHKPGINKLKG